MSTTAVGERLGRVVADIAAHSEQAGRAGNAVSLVAVSKTVSTDIVLQAHDAGHRAFGENRPQELERKARELPDDCEWHMIGHLQKNKVRPVCRHAHWIHSVDSPALLKRIDRIAGEEGTCPNVLIQVNITGEDTKAGVDPAEVRPILDAAAECRNLTCAGLMTMAPFGASEALLREAFGGLRQLRDKLVVEGECQLPHLSMGMSGDYRIAIAEGATMVRIGTAVFGAR
ncbi:MAG: YggS family pyridoxal phosphate-dependent enzyme [Lentisphaerae bacterium]|jgi:PLP dependent protein|nr:YggS family pyridoxal phosphate-dependent enzyme [Lentisphaerota bacterium]MBT4814518.1 YggS family pyridoxal phosphate-dependent enzyme [Lentisphaerota bacterium]MBT5605198.1 YggS family pyridoxal phosphate-dependent enzyme [Lentisphaerota bacterium]MBT7054350.1 YggS family pyridoxal phosphate-dependent enzyme [Lentisphaerota bacterium]MBT7844866.1 YggS family pyridoxal phosphate-dependent enzyme [Lentisphaerota bacterium]